MFRDMKVGAQLAAGFVLVLACMVLIIGVSLRQDHVSHDTLDRIVNTNNVRLQMANDMIGSARERAIAVQDIMALAYSDGSIEEISEAQARVAAAKDSYLKSAAGVKQRISPDDTLGFELLRTLEATAAQALALQDEVIALTLVASTAEAIRLDRGKAEAAMRQWIKETDALIHHSEERTVKRFAKTDEAAHQAQMAMFAFGGLAIGLAVLIGIAIYLRITRPLRQCVHAANSIAAGDLDGVAAALTETRGDEFGLLLQAMNTMVAAIKAMVADGSRLSRAAVEGNLATRADAARHQGDFRTIVEGVNHTISRLVGLLDVMPAPAMIIDTDFTIRYINELGAKLGGKVPGQLIGTRCYDYFQTGDCRTERCACGRAMGEGRPANSETDAHPASGVDLDFAYSGTPLRDEQGRIIGAFEVISDQTSIRQAARVAAKVVSYQEVETQKLVECLARLSLGNVTLAVETEPADADTAAVKKVFDDISSALTVLINTLREITGAAREIAAGNLAVTLEKRGAEDELIQALQDMVATLNEVANQAERISRSDYSVSVEPRSGRDTLGLALQRMSRALRDNRDNLQRQDWLKSGLARLNQGMVGDPDIATLAAKAISEIATTLDAQVGAIYLAEEEPGACLSLQASYAYSKRKNLSNVFHLGEGLVGQAALERKPILIHNVPDDYIKVTSGLGEHSPRAICVMPFIYEGRLKGVVEVGTLSEVTDLQMEYLALAMPALALAFESAEGRMKLARSLQESQVLAEELQAQQKELQATNEELEEQTSALRASEEALKSQQEELQVTNEELEEKNDLLDRQKREVEAARSAIEAQAKDLALASKYKSEFLANMSHELRTPLNSLLLLSQSLFENKGGNLSEDQVEAARIIHGSGSDLLSLINEILDLSKIEAGRMELQLGPVRIEDLAEGVRSSFGHMAEKKGLTLAVVVEEDVPPEMMSDRKRIEQVIRNLLSNAIKFTETGGVTVTFARPGPRTVLQRRGLPPDRCLAVAVRDTGIGITPENHQRIFEAFQQVEGGTARKFGGTGLGLSISRELARCLGGEIQVESELGKGSTFTVYLPTSPGEGQQETPSSAVQSTVARAGAGHGDHVVRQRATVVQIEDDRDTLQPGDRAILVIEDDPTFARLLHDKCRDKGFKCLAAPTGELGLELAAQYQPAAIILDIRLPGIDGWAVLSALKENIATRHIPVHMASIEDFPVEAGRRGAIGYATKPLSQEDLESIFHRLEQVTAGKPWRVLLVEDDAVTSRHTAKLISDGGEVTVDQAATGGEAMAALRAGGYDCVVLDLGLPDMGGLELLEQLEQEQISLPPVIVNTCRELSSEEELALHEHAESVIIKDVRSQERLLDEVSLFLHRVVDQMPDPQRKIIRDLHDSDALLRDKKVLIVDDDMRTTFAMSRFLAERGMQTLKAADGEKALTLLAGHPDIDLVLMDIMMPGMDGYEAMRRIRSQECFRGLPIIALTAKAMPEDREKCLAAGANDYLPKPVDQKRLLSMLRVWLYR